MTDPPRPSVIILAHLTEESLRLISNIQDEMIAKNPDIKHLRVKQEKIHVTMVATYSEDGLQQLFDKTINEVKRKKDLLFELSEVDNFNGNLVAKLRDGMVQDLSTLFMFNCMEDNIPFDDMQTTHVTLFKPERLEMGGFDHMLQCNIRGKTVEINRGPLKIKVLQRNASVAELPI